MAKNIAEIPYTEIVERAGQLARVPLNAYQKIRGIAQDVYVREIPAKFDWAFLIAESSITTTAEIKDGSVTVTTGDTTATFSSVTLTAAVTGRKMSVTGNEAIYSIGFSNSTAVTLAPSFQGNSNVSGGGFHIYMPFYTLASDFDRFLKDGGIDKWIGGRPETIRETTYKEFRELYSSTPGVPEVLRLYNVDTAGRQVIEVTPPPRDSRNYRYDYVRRLAPLYETTAGTLSSIAARGTTVTGNTNCRFTDATTGDWFRVDDFGTAQDSEWYRIIAIAHDSSLTLASAFANSAVTSSANYTISRAPEMPARMHPAVLYGTIRRLAADQNDEINATLYTAQYAEVLSDGKKIYVSRPASQDIETIAEDYNYRR